MLIPHIWCMGAPFCSITYNILAALGAGTGAALLIFMAKVRSDYKHLKGFRFFYSIFNPKPSSLECQSNLIMIF